MQVLTIFLSIIMFTTALAFICFSEDGEKLKFDKIMTILLCHGQVHDRVHTYSKSSNLNLMKTC